MDIKKAPELLWSIHEQASSIHPQKQKLIL